MQRTLVTPLYRKNKDGTETCYYFVSNGPVKDFDKLVWLASEPHEENLIYASSFYPNEPMHEIGPRLAMETPFSSNAKSIAQSVNIDNMLRIEVATRQPMKAGQPISYDRMLQALYQRTLGSNDFEVTEKAPPTQVIPLREQSIEVLRKANTELGLGMDDFDISYYMKMFTEMGRDPTDVELVLLGNSNSEHCRHWFFNGKLIIDGIAMEHTLFELIRAPFDDAEKKGVSHNSLLAFNDNSGALRGPSVMTLMVTDPRGPSRYYAAPEIWHITATAETHNHPTMIAPFPGAATGIGGRIRDTCAVGRGGVIGLGYAGYCVAGLQFDDLPLPGESLKPINFKYAHPRKILVDAILGVSSYGNEIGEPLGGGFVRFLDITLPNGERRASFKPTLYSGGVGRVCAKHTYKQAAEEDMLIVITGGATRPVGVGGGSASSMNQGQNSEDLDYKSVQRGNGEDENRVNRVIRGCIELEKGNPIVSIQDMGAGGLGNALTELAMKTGLQIDVRKVNIADTTMSVMVIVSAESQERYGILIRKDGLPDLLAIARRERVPCDVVGTVTKSGRVVFVDSNESDLSTLRGSREVVNLDLNKILKGLPQKTYEMKRILRQLKPLSLPDDLTIGRALQMVFLHAGSRHFKTSIADRSVTGLVTQQSTCGPYQIPVCDYSIRQNGYFSLTGSAQALGEQPLKLLVNSAAGARICLAEMLTNIMFAGITKVEDIKCRVTVQAQAKMPGEGPFMYDAYVALSQAFKDLNVDAVQTGSAIFPDGGKDSLSMVATVDGQAVKAPMQIQIFGVAPVPDITKRITPDFKRAGNKVAWLHMGNKKGRLGGSILAQCHGQIGDESPDVRPADLLRSVRAVIELVRIEAIESGHDVSDGSLITTLTEMSLASGLGVDVDIHSMNGWALLFAEEAGCVIEFKPEREDIVKDVLLKHNVLRTFEMLGTVTPDKSVRIFNYGQLIYEETLPVLRRLWEAYSDRIDLEQRNVDCVNARRLNYAFEYSRTRRYHLTFEPESPRAEWIDAPDNPKVAILREEGTNGEREMAEMFRISGFDTLDVNMQDLLDGKATLDTFDMVVFPGGFSYMDVFGSAKGWAATILYNERLRDMFERFRNRPDTLSFGVCNGCQLMTLIGWVSHPDLASSSRPRFVANTSGRFESHWSQIKIRHSPAVMLQGMAGSTFGMWVAHGEGRAFFPDIKVYEYMDIHDLIPIVYTDMAGNTTDKYPDCPNGSYAGIAGLCSRDGRHLAMMPHDERGGDLNNWPWVPPDWKGKITASPALRMFQNARKWLVAQKSLK